MVLKEKNPLRRVFYRPQKSALSLETVLNFRASFSRQAWR
jgi:hypothetical protein